MCCMFIHNSPNGIKIIIHINIFYILHLSLRIYVYIYVTLLVFIINSRKIFLYSTNIIIKKSNWFSLHYVYIYIYIWHYLYVFIINSRKIFFIYLSHYTYMCIYVTLHVSINSPKIFFYSNRIEIIINTNLYT